MNLLIRVPPWQMTYLEANYLWGPGGRGINLIKVWKHNRTKGSASISRCPIKKPMMSLIGWRDLPLGAAIYSYCKLAYMVPIAAAPAEATPPPTHPSSVFSPCLLMRPIHLSWIITASITRTFHQILIKPSCPPLFLNDLVYPYLENHINCHCPLLWSSLMPGTQVQLHIKIF